MARFSKESVERLRQAVDLVDLISRYVTLKRSGTSYKGLCPFHDEKSPSFSVQKASNHYHCFGCGAHGDAVGFLMSHERMDFKQALEFLSERFGVPLELEEGSAEVKGPSKARLKQALEAASLFFQVMLLYAEEASSARSYLASRGFSLNFVRTFGLGYAPATEGYLRRYLQSLGIQDDEMEAAGLLNKGKRDFFSERITFPILDATGTTIGFSARKYREETYGGKYINTPETALFKKSRVLFGLFHSKKRMMRDRVACIVEGQLDALRLIEAGFDFCVATLGTAFGPAHAEHLRAMGVEEAFIAFDQDEAGQASTEKVGNILMAHGMNVRCVCLQGAKDPDELVQKYGKGAFFEALSDASLFIPFLVSYSKKRSNWSVPQEKDREIRRLVALLQGWMNKVLVHESLKELASMASIPHDMIVGPQAAGPSSPLPPAQPRPQNLEADLMLELDLVRWLMFAGEKKEVVAACSKNVREEDFVHELPRKLFALTMEKIDRKESIDMLSLASELDTDTSSPLLNALISRKQNVEKALPFTLEVIQKIKERNWLVQRDAIRTKMSDSSLTEEELMALAKEFDEVTKRAPVVHS